MDSSEKESIKSTDKGLSSGLNYGTENVSARNSEADLLSLSSKEKIPYPKSVFFIVINEFCERFSYYGMKAVLTIYLKNVLLFPEDTATVIYHVFSMFCYFTCIFGAMLADSLLGKFKTIFYLSMVYAAGNIILSLAATPPLHIPATGFSMLGLALIAIGTGGIKPCVAAFGGDQFVLPQQEKQLTTFFSVFYFSINAGSLISTFITPIFRKDVRCFDSDTCYPLAFSVPAVLMIVALVIFLFGKSFYKIKPPQGNVVMEVSKCIAGTGATACCMILQTILQSVSFPYLVVFVSGKSLYIMVEPCGNVVLKVIQCMLHAIRNKSGNAPREHWLDHADDKYEKRLIDDIKIMLKVLFLYLPLPVFWALFDQQGSRWTFQATRMDGEVFGWTIKPDQMQVINPFLILALIPIFDQIIYPVLGKCNLLKKPLQRLTVGGVLAGVAFIVSGFLELQLAPTYAIKLVGQQANLNFINTLPCNINITLSENNVESHQIFENENFIYKQINAQKYIATIVPEKKSGCANLDSYSYNFEAVPGKAFTYILQLKNGKVDVFKPSTADELDKSGEGNPKLRIIYLDIFERPEWGNGSDTEIILRENIRDGKNITIPVNGTLPPTFLCEPTRYTVRLNSHVRDEQVDLGTVSLRLGGSYVLTVTKNVSNENYTGNQSYTAGLQKITEPNSIHMLWLLPQYTIITIGEVMFSITGLEFAYSQAPTSMKSVMQSAWLLTVAFGNLIVVVVAESKFVNSQSNEFFLFAGLMFVDMIIFAVMAYYYKPPQVSDEAPINYGTNNEMTAVGFIEKYKGRENTGFHDD